MVDPYKWRMACVTLEPDGVETSGVVELAYKAESDTSLAKTMALIYTLRQVNDTCGLCTAYFVTMSRMRAYSSAEPRRADNRVGVL